MTSPAPEHATAPSARPSAGRLPVVPPAAEESIALAHRPHDRLGERRGDRDWLREAWAAPESRVLEVRDRRVPVETEAEGRVRLAWSSPDEGPTKDSEAVRLLLGQRDGRVHLALLRGAGPDDGASGADGPRWLTLREVVQELHDDDAALALHAVALAEWHAATRFCPRCGGRLHAEQAGHVLACDSCGRHQFPRTDPAVIMVVLAGEGEDERCLLGRQPSWPEGRYSTLAGFVEPGESMEDAVRREVAEETGVRVGEVTWFGDQAWPFPQSLMVGFAARATSEEIAVDGVEIEHAQWVTRAELLREAESGRLVLPGRVSISRSLIEGWYGGELPGRW